MGAEVFSTYVVLIGLQFGALRLWARKPGGWPWLAFFLPIALLIAARFLPRDLFRFSPWEPGMELFGLSYMAFRSSHLVLEVRNGTVPPPGWWRYLGFCFFLPTLSVGPINAYSHHLRAFEGPPPAIPVGRALLRILVGAVKFNYFGTILSTFSYANLLLDNHYHPWMDLPLAMGGYYLFLYCNFAGFCDMAIGAAGLMGVPVSENFNNPFAARNLKDFWNRWHITLSQYMRDVVFSPLSKALARWLGPARVNHAVALASVVVFLLIGMWHGVGWRFLIFGALHALGFVVTHYYTIGLKKWLGREGFKAYNANPWIHAGAVVITFSYVAATTIFFANSLDEIRQIFAALR